MKTRFWPALFLAGFVCANAQNVCLFDNDLPPGQYGVGFSMKTELDYTRYTVSEIRGQALPREMRVYQWYPCPPKQSGYMKFGDYVELATEDFDQSPNMLPVQLQKGLEPDELKNLLQTKTLARENAKPIKERFPVIVVGQGLYYESPLSQVLLCEYLASCGFVVISTPLKGTSCRLVNLTPKDVETQIRDFEFLVSIAQQTPFVDQDKIGILGYDLGGISGLLLCMRNPEVKAFLSLDCSILYPHFSGLPNNHLSYDENRFVIPWLHITQARFINNRRQPGTSSLFERKKFGDSYLVTIETTNHGDFTTYSNVNIQKPVPGYWTKVSDNARAISRIISQTADCFFKAYLNNDPNSRSNLKNFTDLMKNDTAVFDIVFKNGQLQPPSQATLMNQIINNGVEKILPALNSVRKSYPDSLLFNETELNWLGYHFLYWWGREKDGFDLFEWMADAFPDSWNVFDSFGEACVVNGYTDKAIQAYEKSLVLNPQNKNAQAQLDVLK